MTTVQNHKAHRPSKSRDAGKAKGFNEKAFAPRSGRNANAQGRRTAEQEQSRLHVPLVSRTSEEIPPPFIIAVVGPPGVGKSTLVKSLLRRYTKHALHDIKGPVTVSTGKKKRATIIECPSDLNAMLDIGKIADLVILMIDGSFGFEMDTFEFLNILQTHGFPKVAGVITHLDLVSPSQLSSTRKLIKKRFWTELFAGAKLFYLSGVMNGRYPDGEIINMTRFISTLKVRPLIWRNTHPYVLCDRMVDLTPRALLHKTNGNCSRKIALYGWIRGTALREQSLAHIPGVGDVTINKIESLPDPCPLPTEEEKKKRKMSEKQKLGFHAPMSDVGGVTYDKDAVFISVPGNFSRAAPDGLPVGEGEKMVLDLQDARETLADTMKRTDIRLFATSDQNLRLVDDVPSHNLGKPTSPNKSPESSGRISRRSPSRPYNAFVQSVDSSSTDELQQSNSESELRDADQYESEYDSESEFESGSPQRSPRELTQNVSQDNYAALSNNLESLRRRKVTDWTEVIYDVSRHPDSVSIEMITSYSISDAGYTNLGSHQPFDNTSNSTTKPMPEEITRRFITAALDNHDDHQEIDSAAYVSGDNDNEYTTGVERPSSHAQQLDLRKTDLKRRFDEQYQESDDVTIDFYAAQKAEIARKLELNDKELDGVDHSTRSIISGFASGIYARIEIEQLPCEFVNFFDPLFPLVLGGLNNVETQFGLLKSRIKRHRWFPKTLKANDPLIVSLGWRRFQTLPLYALDDHSIRMRALKYTPEHMHCYAYFFSPIAQPNTPFCAFTSLDHQKSTFRVSATGMILSVDQSAQIVKKVKMTGVPYKIYKNTAFIRDMFTTDIEAAKFEGASIRSVSGIRGEIKRAMKKPSGAFRATFEDKILMSDLIFLRSWSTVEPRKFYNPVTSLLLADKSSWKGMRLTGQVRFDADQSVPTRTDSTYHFVDRPYRKFNSLKIPVRLQADLPFASKPKIMRKGGRTTYLQKRAIVLEPEDRKASSLIQQVRALRKDQIARRTSKQNERRQIRSASMSKRAEVDESKQKEKHKMHMRISGQKRKREANNNEEPARRRRKTKS